MSKAKKIRWDDGQQVCVPDNRGKIRTGTLEILSSQVFVQFPEGDGVFLTHQEFKKEATRPAA
jgi:hypothetical protein